MIDRRPNIAASYALAALLMAGCVTPPSPPELGLSGSTGGFVGTADAGAANAPLPPGWWRLFEDAALDAHVERALAANVDLKVAFGNLDVARAAARQADVARLPATVVESGVGPDRADRQPSTSSVPKTSYELGATVAYEIDLFGRLRSAALAGNADAEAAQAALDGVRATVAADTVAAYLDLCTATANAELTARQIVAQQKSYDLVAEQLGAGEVSPLELSQAQLQRDRVAATAPVFEADRRRALFRLAALQGLPPAEAGRLDAPCKALPRIGQPLPVGDGAALIARRPDIREAERRLAAAVARVGVATADLYPRFQIAGSAGLIGGGVDAFLTPLATWAVPNQAAARARIAAAKGSAAVALASWDRVVLRALGEVENALADYRGEQARRVALQAAVGEADKAVRRAGARQRLGAENYLVVLDAERVRNDTALQLLQSEVRIAQIQVALYRALGGGWEDRPGQMALGSTGEDTDRRR
jgi:NodT family efflux transporter outer membrane factor (OMF) lipoprotein